jgi:hypothetical protein
MKRKIIISSCIFLLMAGSVTASSLNGTYKGNPIVKVSVNGKEVSGAVPGIVVDGTTLVPLKVVADAFGATTKWNPTTFSVDVSGVSANRVLKLKERSAISRFYAQLMQTSGYLRSNTQALDTMFCSIFYDANNGRYTKSTMIDGLEDIQKNVKLNTERLERIEEDLKRYKTIINEKDFTELSLLISNLNLVAIDLSELGLPHDVSTYFYMRNQENLDWYKKSREKIFTKLDECDYEISSYLNYSTEDTNSLDY